MKCCYKVFLNILCRSHSFTNSVQWWATGFRLYLLVINLLRNDGQDFPEHILWFTILHKMLQCWERGFRLYLLQLIRLRNDGQGLFHGTLSWTEAVQC